MSVEYGLFSDEGLIEGQLYSIEEANEALKNYDADDDLEIHKVCPDHEGERAEFCELCAEEEEEEEEEE